VATLLAPPRSLMGPIAASEITDRAARSPLHAEYAQTIDRESAREVLQARAEGHEAGAVPAGPAPRAGRAATAPDAVSTILKSPVAREVGKELVRGLFGVLGVSGGTRRSRW
jgi:hypothetical protein